MGNESAVKVYHAEECSQLLEGGRFREIPDRGDLLRERVTALIVNVVTEEIELLDAEFTLVRIDNHTIFTQSAEELAQMVMVLVGRLARHEDVIYVAVDEIKIACDTIDKPLEGLCGVAEAKRHTAKLVQAKRSGYGRLGHVIRVNRDLVVGTDEVYLREDLLTNQVTRKILQMRNRVQFKLMRVKNDLRRIMVSQCVELI